MPLLGAEVPSRDSAAAGASDAFSFGEWLEAPVRVAGADATLVSEVVGKGVSDTTVAAGDWEAKEEYAISILGARVPSGNFDKTGLLVV